MLLGSKLLIGLLLCASSVAALHALDPIGDVRIVVDLTPAGRRARQPTPHHPVLYYPFQAPYTEEGAAYALDQAPPPKEKTEHALAVALAKQGYLFVYGMKPDILLSIVFGTMNPQLVSISAGGRRSANVALNGMDMMAMLIGSDTTSLDDPNVREAVIQETYLPHYFMMVTALSYPDREILWRARVMVPGIHVYFGDVVYSLISKGVPYFGKDTRPQLIPMPIKQGHVELGEPTVKDDDVSSPGNP